MKGKFSRFFLLKRIQIKQLGKHRARTIMLLCSLTFSFTLLLVFVFSAVNFGKYTFWTLKGESGITVYRDDNIVSNEGSRPPFTYETFFKAIESIDKNPLVEDSILYYESVEGIEIKYKEETIRRPIDLLEDQDMRLRPDAKALTKAFGIENFLFGGFPVEKKDIALDEKLVKSLGIKVDSLRIGHEPMLLLDGNEFRLKGVISLDGLISTSSLMFKSSYTGHTKLNYVSFFSDNRDSLKELKAAISKTGIISDDLTKNVDNTLFMLLIEVVLIILALTVTIVSMFMYYSNFRSLIKECEKQTCLSYYLGKSKDKTVRDTLFKLCFIGTVAFLFSALFASLVGLFIDSQRGLVFGGMPLYSIAMPNIIGLLIGYLLCMTLIILLFYRPIRRNVVKLPNSFGGNV